MICKLIESLRKITAHKALKNEKLLSVEYNTNNLNNIHVEKDSWVLNMREGRENARPLIIVLNGPLHIESGATVNNLFSHIDTLNNHQITNKN